MIHQPLGSEHYSLTDVWHAIVIGAGPAGSMAARTLALAGVRVLLIERRRMPRPKVCGACLNRRATEWLDHAGLGSLLDDLRAVPTRKFRVASGGRSVELDLPGGAAVSRDAFDVALVDQAVAAGATFWPATTASLAESGVDEAFRSVRVERERQALDTIRGRVIVVADGLAHPSLANCPEFVQHVAPASRVGISTTFDDPSGWLEPGTIAMHVGRHGYVGLVRIEDGRVNVAAAVDVAALRRAESSAELVAAILAEAGAPDMPLPSGDAWRGTLPLTRQLGRPAGTRVLVIGDAAGYVEPFTGEGMAWALGGGWLVAPLVELALREGWSTAIEQSWLETHRRLVRERLGWCRALATLVRHPLLANCALRVAGVWPALCRPIVRALNRPIQLDLTCRP